MEIPGYQMLQAIGEGGMATAYLAIQTSLGRKVVLKVLDTSQKDSAEQVERFLNEGRIIASLNHPNVITIYDVGIAEDSIFLAMEYVEGGDLRARLSNIVSPAEAFDIIQKVAGGLDAAHKSGIVHRDVKPANILFRRDGTPLLSDFGIAKKLTLDHNLTSTGIFLGSPNYMAPEQAEAGPIDGRADIYSLGIIVYEMLTGIKPYQSDSVINVIVKHKQAPIPTLPPGLEDYQPVLNLMLAKDRRDRFRDAESLIHYIKNLERTGKIRRGIELESNPDIDITGSSFKVEDVEPRTFTQLALTMGSMKRTRRALLGALVIAAVLFVGLEIAATWMDAQVARPTMAVRVAAVSPPPASADAPTPARAGTAGEAEVINALAWLAQNSLEEYRLTDPPKDNAHYYYSRILQIEPDNVAARQGILQVAERFAVLAERELANSNPEKAQNYIQIGLQIDPQNQTLRELQTLAKPRDPGLFQRLARLFTSG